MEWRARRWRRLLNFIEHLPPDTHYHKAIALDEDHAREMLKHVRPSKDWEPDLSDFGLTHRMLADVHDMLQSIRNTLISANSKKGAKRPEFTPYPRPQTAAQRLSVGVRLQKHRALAARLLGGPQSEPEVDEGD